MITCPACLGKKEMMAFVSYMEGHSGPPVQKLPCHTCDGVGVISEEMVKWMEHGRKLRDKRLAAGYGLRKMAERLGVSATEVSRAECGRFDNLAIDWPV